MRAFLLNSYFTSLILLFFFCISLPLFSQTYEQRGVGGGGAMSGFSMSPYSDLWFVGTDMGHIYRSTDRGISWRAVDHFQAQFSADLPNATYLGFNPDINIIFHAYEGCAPKRSTDGGLSWTAISSLENLLPTGGYDFSDCKNDANSDRIRYWLSNSEDENIVLAASGNGLFRSADKGINWTTVPNIYGESTGTVWDYSTTPHTVYHANQDTIFVSADAGLSFSIYQIADIRSFTGGRDANGLTLAFIEEDDSDCTGGNIDEHCGNIHLEINNGGFTESSQVGGDWVRMAENNSQILYVTGSRNWNVGEGTKIWVSEDAGQNFSLQLQQLLLDPLPYRPWPSENLEWSGVGMDIGYDDGGYRSFSVNRRNATEAGGTGNYFLHVTRDTGNYWEAPFTEYADTGEVTEDKKWRSTGIEPTSAWHLEFHPENPQVGFVGYADIGGLCTEDGGETWRIVQAEYNSTYDHAFDSADDNIVYGAVSSKHDFPYNWYGNVDLTSPGGIYKSINRGRNWTRLTANSGDFNTPFLAIAYDDVDDIIYGGTQGRGIAKSTDDGATWTWINDGLGSAPKIISQIEIDPATQDLYLMLVGDRPNFTNINETGIYKLAHGSTTWELLRGTVHPPGTDGVNFIGPLWRYPVHFAVDWRNTDKMWLTDIRNYGTYKAAGIWLSTDGGDNWYQKKEAKNPHRITLDPCDTLTVYVNGMGGGEDVPNSSGSMYTTDGGDTWSYNTNLPIHYNLSGLTIDPNNTNKVFYTSFGGGMWYGDKPQANPIDCGLAVVLPVEISHFSVVCENNSAFLRWQTLSEQDNKGFEIQSKNSNSTDWKTIGFVESKGNGNEYEFTDIEAKSERLFYRLKQIDLNGEYNYSKIVTNDCGEGISNFKLYPNPTNGITTVSFPAAMTGDIQVFDVLGKLIFTETLNNTNRITLDKFPVGTYFVKFGAVVQKLVVSYS